MAGEAFYFLFYLFITCLYVLTVLFFFYFLQRGIRSPRAYVPYDSLQEPDPKYFEQILTNSLPEGQIQQFCADFLALFRDKEHKRPVPCAIGASDSGKTSLFSPVFQIVPLNRIARVTKQKSFNKSMIDTSTEVIFLDEAYNNLLDIDDWKIICQGGFTSHDVKWKKAQGFHCRASMYITCQQEMDFGEAHNDAMNRRLHKYFFRSLPQVNPEANQWLREHAMDCIVWAQQMVATNSTTTQTGRTLGEREDGLQSEDIQRTLSVSLLDDHAPECSTEGGEISLTNEEEREAESESSDENEGNKHIDKLRHELEKVVPGCLRHRHLAQMLRTEEHKKREEERSRAERRRKREDFLRSRGVSNANLSLLPDDLDDPTPSPIARDLQRYDQARVAAEEQASREAAREAFLGTWLRSTEKDLKRCCERYQASDDSSERSTLKAYIKQLTGRLRDHHVSLGTFGTAEAVAERKRVCTLLGLLDQRQQHLVTSVAERLPLASTTSYDPPENTHQTMFTPPTSQEVVESESEDEFITPKTPCYEPSFDENIFTGSSPLLRRVPSPDNRPSKRARLSRSQTIKGQKRVTSFFSSQKHVTK